MARVEPTEVSKVGDRVKWTSHANGGRHRARGVIKRDLPGRRTRSTVRPSQGQVSSVNKRTGKPNAVKVYMPARVALTLVERAS